MINFEAERTTITFPDAAVIKCRRGIWLSKSSGSRGPIPNKISFERMLCKAAGINPDDRVDFQYSTDAIFMSKSKVGLLTIRHANPGSASENTALTITNTYVLASLEAWCRRRYGEGLNDIVGFECEAQDGTIGFVPLFGDTSHAA